MIMFLNYLIGSSGDPCYNWIAAFIVDLLAVDLDPSGCIQVDPCQLSAFAASKFLHEILVKLIGRQITCISRLF